MASWHVYCREGSRPSRRSFVEIFCSFAIHGSRTGVSQKNILRVVKMGDANRQYAPSILSTAHCDGGLLHPNPTTLAHSLSKC
jgi:hypothetical protein